MSEEQVKPILEKLLDFGKGPKKESAGLTAEEIDLLCEASKKIFMDEPSLLKLQPPVVICGDLLGNFGDLLRIFDLKGAPPASDYIFLGNYVDEGSHSIETYSLLLCYKILYPSHFHMLRGQHECSYITRKKQFYDDCIKFYSETIWQTFCESFNYIPIAALVGSRIFCVHSGISPELKSPDDINNLKRPLEVPEKGLLNDLLNYNPDDECESWGADPDEGEGEYKKFGLKPVNEFLKSNDLDLICRGHQISPDGYEFPFKESQALITIFSVCEPYLENLGAVLDVGKNLSIKPEFLQPIE